MNDTERGELIDALLEMRSLLADPDHWTYGRLAFRLVETHFGRANVTIAHRVGCAPSNPEAVGFCLVGAAARAERSLVRDSKVVPYLEGMLRRTYGRRIKVQGWNDGNDRNHDQIIGLIEAALDELKNPVDE